MESKRKNPDFLNGVPELLILQLLSRRPMYGYELVQAIKASTGSVLEFGEGCIYPILHRLEAGGLLEGSREKVGGRSRVVYRPTAAGRGRMTEAADAWTRVAAAIQQVLQGSGHGRPALA